MIEYVTLTKNSPDFESYLLGTFAKDKRALPITTLNVNSSAETVTFKIVPLKEIELSAWGSVLLQTFKVRSFLLVLVPLFLVLSKNISDESLVDPMATLMATWGVFCAFVAVNLRNDFMDHMKGVDRILERSGSRAIQNGWVRAITIKKLSTFFLILAFGFAIPLMVVYPWLGAVILPAAIVGILAQFRKQSSFKYRRFGEVLLFVMFGPLLTVGYQLSMGAGFDEESFWIGCVWGWLVLFVVHLRNFRNILPSSQAGFSNTVNWLGFDRSRRLLAGWWFLFMVFNLAYHYVYAGIYWGFYLTLGLAFVSLSFIGQMKKLSSPAGSEMVAVFRRGYALYLIAVGLWVFECLWYLSW